MTIITSNKSFNIVIFIEPHERFEAVEVYKDKLTVEQIDMIYGAPENALIELRAHRETKMYEVMVIEEG